MDWTLITAARCVKEICHELMAVGMGGKRRFTGLLHRLFQKSFFFFNSYLLSDGDLKEWFVHFFVHFEGFMLKKTLKDYLSA